MEDTAESDELELARHNVSKHEENPKGQKDSTTKNLIPTNKHKHTRTNKKNKIQTRTKKAKNKQTRANKQTRTNKQTNKVNDKQSN